MLTKYIYCYFIILIIGCQASKKHSKNEKVNLSPCAIEFNQFIQSKLESKEDSIFKIKFTTLDNKKSNCASVAYYWEDNYNCIKSLREEEILTILGVPHNKSKTTLRLSNSTYVVYDVYMYEIEFKNCMSIAGAECFYMQFFFNNGKQNDSSGPMMVMSCSRFNEQNPD